MVKFGGPFEWGFSPSFAFGPFARLASWETQDAALEGEVGRFDCFLSAGLPEVRHVYTLKEEYTVGEATRGALAPLAESTGGTS